MEIYIVEDDVTVISILEDIIEDNELGTVCGTTEGGPANVDEILALEPDVILVDFLMPGTGQGTEGKGMRRQMHHDFPGFGQRTGRKSL